MLTSECIIFFYEKHYSTIFSIEQYSIKSYVLLPNIRQWPKVVHESQKSLHHYWSSCPWEARKAQRIYGSRTLESLKTMLNGITQEQQLPTSSLHFCRWICLAEMMDHFQALLLYLPHILSSLAWGKVKPFPETWDRGMC